MAHLPRSTTSLVMLGGAIGCAVSTLALVGIVAWPDVVLTASTGRVIVAIAAILGVMFGFYRSIMRRLDELERSLARLDRFDRYGRRADGLTVVRDG